MDQKAWTVEIIERQRLEVSKVISRLQTASDSVRMTGDKINWCLCKLLGVLENLDVAAKTVEKIGENEPDEE